MFCLSFNFLLPRLNMIKLEPVVLFLFSLVASESFIVFSMANAMEQIIYSEACCYSSHIGMNIYCLMRYTSKLFAQTCFLEPFIASYYQKIEDAVRFGMPYKFCTVLCFLPNKICGGSLPDCFTN